jgi:hypothetical protein
MSTRTLSVFGTSDYNNKIKRDSAMSKLMGELLNNNVAVEGVDVLGKKIKSMKNVKIERSKKSVAGADDQQKHQPLHQQRFPTLSDSSTYFPVTDPA